QYAFQAYEVSAAANRAVIHKVPATAKMGFDLGAMADYFFAHPEAKIRLIFIANPNNPTGTYLAKTEVEAFLRRFQDRDDVLIVFDEAYNEFVRAPDYASAMGRVSDEGNVVVLRTLSKAYGLAGFRVGVMLAPSAVLDIVHRVRKPFNVNGLAQVAAVAALQDMEFIEATRQLTWKGLDYFYSKLREFNLPFVPSEGNFVLFDSLRDAALVNEALLRRGIILRPVGNYGLPRHLRVSAGLEHENRAAMEALGAVLAEIPPL
ncbi:MAG: aminotransferase class I/II-fold pyridoxal phosphate-dependent enzyme, partial [Bdellovibrionaceae bacterium]|nr:aminotransferase class I/II-fold pyridoxal phosphate-dependent enzyme [Pseudobdellovibrionaceae bacterium]